MITEAIFQARIEARRLQRIGLLISFVMTQVNDAPRGGRKQVRLDEVRTPLREWNIWSGSTDAGRLT